MIDAPFLAPHLILLAMYRALRFGSPHYARDAMTGVHHGDA
ncbi:MAG TPA: hypothetical protein VNZ58_12945 [Thermomicrobiales bacterium]|nr:hypothetical protein [Thermomicrobiales bacterium]